jgi:MinD-like ATPase involved in chromosome partitioning or flagellar assembly
MRSDVRQLLQGLTTRPLRYRDVRDLERRAAGCAALGLAAPARLDLDAAPLPEERNTVVGPIVAALVSGAPGAGATTVAAGLADLLAQEGHACGVVDLAPPGELARRLAPAAPPLEDGEFARVRSRTGVEVVAARCRAGGDIAPQAIAASWERIATTFAGCACIVADVPSSAAAMQAALTTADEVIVVVRGSGAPADAARALAAWPRGARPPLRFLLNAFDARRAADRAARAALEAVLGPAFLPFVVHEDPAVGGVPAGASLAEHAAESQALRDLSELAAWLLRRPEARAVRG